MVRPAEGGWLPPPYRCHRHCPIVSVHDGTFWIMATEVVLADGASQVAAGAWHLTSGDPGSLNQPAHALRVV